MSLNTSYSDLPRQKLARSQKTDKWVKQTVDAIVSNSNLRPNNSEYRKLLESTYDYYNGIIDDDDYTHVTRPYGKSRENFPAKLHNYPIIKPIIDLLLGEKRKRPIGYTVAVANADAVTKREEEIKAQVVDNLKQIFINEMSALGVQTDLATENEPLPEEVAEAARMSYQDARAARGQQSLEFLEYDLELKNQFAKGFFHFLVSGLVYSYKDVVADEAHYEMLNPLNVDFDKSPDTEYIEDGQWAIHRMLATPSMVLDLYYEDLTQAQIDQIERPKNSTLNTNVLNNNGVGDDDDHKKSDFIEVIRVFWKTMTKFGIVTYQEDGQIYTKEVEEGYKKEEGESVEWLWGNEVWQCTLIDDDIYVRSGPHAVQRTSLDNKSKCKLPINGRKYSDMNSANVSICMLAIPYQLQYNIYKYRLDNAVAKSKDVIAQLDINLIPKGWEMDTFMYYLDATGIAWVDYAKEGIQIGPQHQTVMDMTVKTITDYITLLESIRMELEELTGVSRQRKGQISQYDGKASAEQSIIQSSHITEDLFAKFSGFERRELQGLLDTSKLAWINGKKAMYVLSDLSKKYLEIDGVDHMESEYGVYVSNSSKDLEKVQIVQQLAQAMVQNGSSISSIVEIVEASSLSQIKDKIKKAEESAQKLAEAQMAAEQESAQLEQQQKQVELNHESRENELDRQNKIQTALIQAEAQRTLAELNIGSIDDSSAIELEREKISRQDRLEREKLAHQKNVDNKKMANDKLKAQAAMKSASRPTGPKK